MKHELQKQAPPGIRNMVNGCYMNAVLQASVQVGTCQMPAHNFVLSHTTPTVHVAGSHEWSVRLVFVKKLSAGSGDHISLLGLIGHLSCCRCIADIICSSLLFACFIVSRMQVLFNLPPFTSDLLALADPIQQADLCQQGYWSVAGGVQVCGVQQYHGLAEHPQSEVLGMLLADLLVPPLHG